MSYDPWLWTLEFAPAFSPLDLPEEADWASLGTPFSIAIRRGRQDDLGEFEAGTMTVTLDNADESLDHLLASSDIYDADALPFTPVRLIARKGVTDDLPDGYDVRVLFTGYTLDGFAPSGLRGGGTVSVQVVDWMGWAETLPSPDSRWAAWVTYAKPTAWARGLTKRTYTNTNDNPDGVLWNMAAVYTGAGNDFYPDPTYPSYVGRMGSAAGSVMPSPTTPTLFLGDFSPGTTFGGVAMDVADSLTQVGVWMAAGWFKAKNAQTITWGGSDWSVYLNASGHIQADVDVGGFAQSDAVPFDHTDEQTHLWILKVTSTGGARAMQIETDLGIDSHAFGAAAVSGGGRLGFRGLGGSETLVGDFVYWDDPTVLAEIFATSDGYGTGGQLPVNWVFDGGDGLWYADTITERIPRIFRSAAVGVIPYQTRLEIDHELNGHNPAGTLAADIRVIGSSFLGAAYMLRDGTLRIRDASFSVGTVVDAGESINYDFTTVETRISDESATSTWTQTVTDNFNRANNASVTNGNPLWQFGYTPIDGAIGVISNAAYVSDASAAENIVLYQDLGRDVTITCDFASPAPGQGVVLRHSSYGNYITVTQGLGTVDVYGWVEGVSTLIGNTGADTLGTALTVTIDDNILTVQIDAGTVHTFTITEPVHSSGIGVGLAYAGIGVLPASSARWDNFSATAERPLIRASNRSRTAPRADRVVNNVSIPGFNMYTQDADSMRRYGNRPKSYTSIANDATGYDTVEGYIDVIIAERKDPTIEVGDLTLYPWGDQYLTDWAMRDLELERAVQYREALYRAGTEVLDATYRVAGESWDWSNGSDWTITLKLVPA